MKRIYLFISISWLVFLAIATVTPAQAKTATDVMTEIATYVKGKTPRLSAIPGLGKFLEGTGDFVDVTIKSAEVKEGVLLATISLKGKDSEFMAWPKNYEEILAEGAAPVFYTLILGKGDLALDALWKPKVNGAKVMEGLSFSNPMVGIWMGEEEETFKLDEAPELVKKRLERIEYKRANEEDETEGDAFTFRQGVNLYAKFKISDGSVVSNALNTIKVDTEDRSIYAWVDPKGVAQLVNKSKPKGENIAFRFVSEMGAFNPGLGSWYKPHPAELIIQSEGGNEPVTFGIYGKVDYAFSGDGGDVFTADTEISYDMAEKAAFIAAEFNKTAGKKGPLEKIIGLKATDVGLGLEIKKGESKLLKIKATLGLGGNDFPIEMSYTIGGPNEKLDLMKSGIKLALGNIDKKKVVEVIKASHKAYKDLPKPIRDRVKAMLKSAAGTVVRNAGLLLLEDQTVFSGEVGDIHFSVVSRKVGTRFQSFIFVDANQEFNLQQMVPEGTPGREMVDVNFSPPILVFAGIGAEFETTENGENEWRLLPEYFAEKIKGFGTEKDPIESVYVGSGVTLIGMAPMNNLPGAKEINKHITLEMPERGYVTGSVGMGISRLMGMGTDNNEMGFSFSMPVKKFDPTPRKLTQEKTFFNLDNPRFEMEFATAKSNSGVGIGISGNSVIDIGGSNKAKTKFKIKLKVGTAGKGLKLAIATGETDEDTGEIKVIKGVFGLKWLDLENFTVAADVDSDGFDAAFRGAGRVGRKLYDITVKADINGGLTAMRFEFSDVHMTDILTLAQVIVLNGEERVNFDEVPQFSLKPLTNPSEKIKQQPGFQEDKVVLSYVAPLSGDKELGLEEGVHFYGGLELYGMQLGDAYGSADENGFFMEGKTGSAKFGPVEFRENTVNVDIPFELGTVPEVRIKGQTPKILGTADTLEMIFAYDKKEKGIVAKAVSTKTVLDNQKTEMEIKAVLKQKVANSTFGFRGEMQQQFLDAIRDKTKESIDRDFGNLDGDYQNAQDKLDKAGDTLLDKTVELDYVREQVHEEIARAKRPIANARRKVDGLSKHISSINRDISYYQKKADDKAKKLDFIGAIEAAARMTEKGIELVGVEAAYHTARAVLKALEDSFDYIPVESHPMVLAKLTEVQVARIGVEAASAIVDAAKAVNGAMRDALKKIVSAVVGDTFNVRRAAIIGDLGEALNNGDGLKMEVEATVLGGDMLLEMGFRPQDPAYMAEQVAGVATQFATAILYQKKRKHGITPSQQQAWKKEIEQAKLGYEPKMNRAGFSFKKNRTPTVVMFMEDKMLEYNFQTGRTNPGYPKSIERKLLSTDPKWSIRKAAMTTAQKFGGMSYADGMPQTGAMVDAVLQVREDRAYLFKGASYFRVELDRKNQWRVKKSGLISKDWPGLWKAVVAAGRQPNEAASRQPNEKEYAFGGVAGKNVVGKKGGISMSQIAGKMVAERGTPQQKSQPKTAAKSSVINRGSSNTGDRSAPFRAAALAEARELEQWAKRFESNAGAWNIDAAFYAGDLKEEDGIADDKYGSNINSTVDFFNKDDGFAYFFVHDKVITYNVSEAKVVSTKPIEDVWRGVWDRNIDVAIPNPHNRSLVYLFSGDEYVSVSLYTKKITSEAKKIKDGWTLTPEFTGGGNPATGGDSPDTAFDAAVRIGNTPHPYYIKGNQVLLFNREFARLDLSYPRYIEDLWPGVWEDDSVWEDGIDAAVRAIGNDNLLWFFKGPDYKGFDLTSRKVVERGSIRKRWPALWNEIAKRGGRIDAAHRDPRGNGTIYFYVNDYYLTLNGGKLGPVKPINSGKYSGMWTKGMTSAVADYGNGVWFTKDGQVARHNWDQGKRERGFPVAFGDFWTGTPIYFIESKKSDLKDKKPEYRSNLASLKINKKRKVWQSSNYKNKYSQENAVDGDVKTYNHTNNGFNEGYYIDLGDVYKIDEVVIFNRLDNAKTWSRMNGLEVMISDWPMTQAGWLLRRGDNVTRRTISKAGKTNSLLINKTGRYIGLRQTRNDFLHMSEIHVIGKKKVVKPTTDETKNLALNKPTRQSSQYKNHDQKKATDGNLGTFNHTKNGGNEWLEVDLGAVHKIDTVVLENRKDGTAATRARLSGALVYVSDWPMDDYTFATSNDETVHVFDEVGKARDRKVIKVDKTGRYVRVQLPGSEFLHLAELGVYGSPKKVSPKTKKPGSGEVAARKGMIKAGLASNIMSAASYKCVGTGNKTKNGNKTFVWHCNKNAKDQSLRVEYTKKDTFRLRNLGTGRCLTVAGSKTTSDTPVVEWDCLADRANQEWTRHDLTKGWFALASKLNGNVCLMAEESGVDAGTPLVISKCSKRVSGQVFALWDGGPKAGGVVWDAPTGARRLSGAGQDIALDNKGVAYVINKAPNAYSPVVYRRKPGGDWENIGAVSAPGPQSSRSSSGNLRVASGGGALWAVGSKGRAYIHKGRSGFVQEGNASSVIDIAVDAKGSAYVLKEKGDVMKFVNRRWTRVRNNNFKENPIRIAVEPKGVIWLVEKNGTIIRGKTKMPGKAKDIAINDKGAIYVIGLDGKPYKWNGRAWILQEGKKGASIAVGPKGRPWFIQSDKKIMGW